MSETHNSTHDLNHHAKVQRRILRALFKSAKMTDEDIRWRKFRFDPDILKRQLRPIAPFDDDAIDNIAKNYELSVLRRDPLTLSYHGFEKKLDRNALAEGAGAMGIRFLPTQRSATRCAFEAAREIAYFGYGSPDQLFFQCPIQQLTAAATGARHCQNGTILRDLRDDFAIDYTAYTLLAADKYFTANVTDAAGLVQFQRDLRSFPMSDAFVEKCAEFFDRKATVGVRDSLRWFLGARHPWFDWTRAKFLIQTAFHAHGTDDFNTPQITYYAYDPNIDDVEIDAKREYNAPIVEAFANALKRELKNATTKPLERLSDAQLQAIARATLDIHHDYPDFDLEAQNETGPQKQIDFMEQSIQKTVDQELLGKESTPRCNLNFRAHFAANDVIERICPELAAPQCQDLFNAIDKCIAKYDEQGGVAVGADFALYKRIPCTVFLIQSRGCPTPKPDERLLDSFDLSQMTQLEHASYMRSFPEISEKLTVFFTLTLRHLIDTEHVPDLRPRNLARDFLVLGLWGTRTPNIHVNLYVDKSLSEKDYAKSLKRCEIKFTGTEQVETHPLSHIRESSKVVRFAFAHFTPLIEPSILRNLGTFTMAMEEFRNIGHTPQIDPWSLTHYAFDMIHEMTRCGIRRSLSDVLAVLEYVLDNAYDNVKKRISANGKTAQK